MAKVLQITTSVTRVTSVPRVVGKIVSLRQHPPPLRKLLSPTVIAEIDSPETSQRAAGMHWEPVIATQKEPLARSAGDCHDLVLTLGHLDDEPGDNASVIIDVKLGAPDAPTQGLDNVIEEPGSGRRPV